MVCRMPIHSLRHWLVRYGVACEIAREGSSGSSTKSWRAEPKEYRKREFCSGVLHGVSFPGKLCKLSFRRFRHLIYFEKLEKLMSCRWDID